MNNKIDHEKVMTKTNENIPKMEILGCYSLYDKESQKWDVPFFAFNNLFAKRHFTQMLQNKNSMLRLFKDKYILMKIGEFNVLSGIMIDYQETVIEGLQINLEEDNKS